jgi:hypothetical protein
MKPNDSHGKPENITLSDLRKAARAGDTTIDDAVKNMNKTLKVAQKSKK